MDRKVFDQLTDYLGNERLDGIVLQTKEYRAARELADAAYEKLLELELAEDTKSLLEDYMEKYNAVAAVFDRLAYRQGMKDLMELFVSLIA